MGHIESDPKHDSIDDDTDLKANANNRDSLGDHTIDVAAHSPSETPLNATSGHVLNNDYSTYDNNSLQGSQSTSSQIHPLRPIDSSRNDYSFENEFGYKTNVFKHTRSTKANKKKGERKYLTSLRFIFPVLPLPLAWVCGTLNFFVPGFGTFVAGLGGMFYNTYLLYWYQRLLLFILCIFIAVLQLVLALFVIGWLWSIAWALAFIVISDEQRRWNVGAKTTNVGAFEVFHRPPSIIQSTPPADAHVNADAFMTAGD